MQCLGQTRAMVKLGEGGGGSGRSPGRGVGRRPGAQDGDCVQKRDGPGESAR